MDSGGGHGAQPGGAVQRASGGGHEAPRGRGQGHSPALSGHAGMLDDVPVPVRALLAGMVVLMLAVTGIGFWLSYESLHRWAGGHGLRGQAAWVWPAAVDSFIGIGELGSAVFLWIRRSRTKWWERVSWYFAAVTALGFAGSLAANIAAAGRDGGAQFVAALPPAAALVAFAGLIRVGHELFDRWEASVPVPVSAPVSAPGAGVAAPAPAVPAPVEMPPPVPVPAVKERAPEPAVPPAPPTPAVPGPDAPARAPRRVAAARAPRVPATSTVVHLDEGEEERARARRMYEDSIAAGKPMSVADMVAATCRSERWCKARRAEVHQQQPV